MTRNELATVIVAIIVTIQTIISVLILIKGY